MRKLLYGLIGMIWMALIFWFSHQPAVASNELSSGITEWIVQAIERVLPNDTLDKLELNHMVRKNAHFMIYLVLGFIVISTLKRIGLHGSRGVIISVMVCVLFAITDEVHQLFVAGRGAQVQDVLIDSAGAITGMGIYFIAKRIRRPKSLPKNTV